MEGRELPLLDSRVGGGNPNISEQISGGCIENREWR